MLEQIYNFTEPRHFLAAVLKEKQTRNPAFSVRAWARQLGFNSPSFFSAVLRGDRSFKPELAIKVSKNLGLSEEKAKYLGALALLSSAKTPSEKELYTETVESLKPSPSYFNLEIEQFKFLSDWFHFAILEMVDLADFKNDPEFISKRLGGEVSRTTILEAIERLKRLNLLKLDSEGRLVKARGEPRVGDKIPSEAIKNHHVQMIEKAKSALYKQKMEERDFRGSTFVIERKSYPKAQKLIKKFHSEMQKLASKSGGEEVYRFNTQFFKLTTHEEGEE